MGLRVGDTQKEILNSLKRYGLKYADGRPLQESDVELLLSRQGLLLLFDGLNELAEISARRELENFRNTHERCPMVFTTRAVGAGDFLAIKRRLELEPLTDDQMRAFIRKRLPEGGAQLFHRLQERLREPARRPLFLDMICRVHQATGTIPHNLGLLLRDFTRLYEREKEKESPAEAERLELRTDLLRCLAFRMMGTEEEEARVALTKEAARAELVAFFREHGETDPPPPALRVPLLLLIRGEAALDEMERRMQSEKPEIRKAAIWGLADIGGRRAGDLLARALQDPDHDNRRAAADNLHHLGHAGNIEALRKLLATEDDSILRIEIAETLLELGDAEHVAKIAIADLLAGKENLFFSVEHLLIDPCAVIKAALAAAADEPEDSERFGELRRALLFVDLRHAGPALRKAYFEGSPGARRFALDCLSDLGGTKRNLSR